MGLLPRRGENNAKLDVRVLRKNDISILILDERWNMLFENTPKTSSIEKFEENLKELLKEESRLFAEQNDIAEAKKRHMEKIINLTEEVFEKKHEDAKKAMQESEAEIKRINERTKTIEAKLDDMPERIKRANLKLLEETVNVVYYKFRAGGKRIGELEKLLAEQERVVEEAREKMKTYIEEKEALSDDDTDVYSYFHDLLGAEELEKLDKKFFKEKRKRK